ncbi:hypothetical protein Tco_0966029 [Tanacetum coccineum]
MKSHIRSRDVTFNEDSLYGAKAATDSSNLTKPNQKDQVVLKDSPENLANDSIVVEHGLNKEGILKMKHPPRREASETPQVQRSSSKFRAPIRYSPSTNYLLLTENGEPEYYSEAFSSKESVQWKNVINEEIVSLKKN